MPKYEVEYEVKLLEWGSVQLEADNPDSAEDLAAIEVDNLYEDEYTDFSVLTVREIKE